MGCFGSFVIRIYNLLVAFLTALSFIPLLNILTGIIAWFLLLQVYFFDFLLCLPLKFTSLFFSRQDEYAADAYACEIGLGQELYAGLAAITAEEPKLSFWQSLISDHPVTPKRLQKIATYLQTH